MKPAAQKGGDAIFTAPFRNLTRPPGDRRPPRKRRGRHSTPVAALIGWLRGCWQRERQRRELAAMRVRDFGDLAVPESLVIDELRRWPWQKMRDQWGEVATRPHRGRRDDGRDGADAPVLLPAMPLPGLELALLPFARDARRNR